MDGFVFVDKPKGLTSFQVCEIVKRKLNAKKAGHAGTLDPNVTGLLIVALGKATKLMPLFLKLDKEYVGLAHLHKDVSLEKLDETIKKDFIGKIKQIPPRRSKVARRLRERTVYSFKVIKKMNKDFSFKVRCEAGTYIRKLIHDLGIKLKVGAHMKELRRIKQGPFSLEEAVSLEKLTEKSLKSMEEVITRIAPIVFVSKEAAEKLREGKFLKAREILKIDGKFGKEQLVVAFSEKKIVAIVKPFYKSSEIKKKPGYVLKPERVI